MHTHCYLERINHADPFVIFFHIEELHLQIFYSEIVHFSNFSITFIITFFSGLALYQLSTKENTDLRTKDGFIITVFFWTVLALFGIAVRKSRGGKAEMYSFPKGF